MPQFQNAANKRENGKSLYVRRTTHVGQWKNRPTAFLKQS